MVKQPSTGHAHGPAYARKISDTSRQGRYHNRRYATLAGELGLDVAQVQPIGWSVTSVPDPTAARYAETLTELTAALVLWRRAEQAGRVGLGRSRNALACSCGCGRRIRVARSVLELAPILCAGCAHRSNPTTTLVDAYQAVAETLEGLAVGQDGRVTETWDSIADWYAERLAAGSAPHQLAITAILQLLPAVTDQPVLDLGCGEGQVARTLAEQGAQVTGIDLSQRMIGHARRQETAHPLGIDFRVGDAQTLAGLADGAFAGVVANLSLHNVDDLGAAVGAVRRVLRPGGWLVFTIPHPCLETPHASSATTPDGRAAQLVYGYFEERFWRSDSPQGFRRAGNWHRTLATYLNTLVDGGFVVTRVLEPEPSPALAASHPGRADVPMFLVVRAARQASPADALTRTSLFRRCWWGH